MIESLTDEQVAKFPEYVAKWVDIGLATGKTNLDECIPLLHQIYINGGLEPPQLFGVVESPMGLSHFHSMVESDAGVPDFKSSTELQEFLDNMPKNQKSGKLPAICYGNMDAPSLSFYDYIHTELEIENLDKMLPLIELAKYCGWWLPYEHAVILCDKPEFITMDDNNLLHNETGPAIKYADGFAVYSWRGVRIPAEWIEDKESLTPTIALTYENIEQRRCACEILGWDNVISGLNPKIIDIDDNPEIGQLIEVDLPDIGTERFLKVQCGTGRSFSLPVPPDVETALDANAWTYGLAANDYIPEVRT